MNKLNEIWNRQKSFTSNIISLDSLSTDEKRRYTKEMILHLVSEIDELLASTGRWKLHKMSGSIPLKSGIAEELVDMFKYIVNIALIWNISAEEFFKMFMDKSEIVEFKYEMEKNLNLIKRCPVIAVDFDGVLNSYPKEWLDYLNSTVLARSYNKIFVTVSDAKKFMGEQQYAFLKERFREEGGELLYKPNTEIIDALSEIKESFPDVSVVVLTSRPVWRNKRFFMDSLKWLRENNVPFDAILWAFDKEDKLLDFSRVICVIEDELLFANNLAANGYKVILLNRSYNNGFTHSNVIRIDDSQAKKIINNLLQKYYGIKNE